METLAARNRLARFLGSALAVTTLLAAIAAFDAAWANRDASVESLALRLALGAVGLAFLRLCWLLMLATRAIRFADELGDAPLGAAKRAGRNANVIRLSGLLLAMATTFGAANATAAPAPLTTAASSHPESVSASNFVGLELPGDPSTVATDSPDTTSNVVEAIASPSPVVALPGLDSRCDLTPGWLPNPDISACGLVVGNISPAEQSEHVVTRGQTLWSIAGSYLPPGSSGEAVAKAVDEWVRANPSLLDPNAIRVGDVLIRPSAQGATR